MKSLTANVMDSLAREWLRLDQDDATRAEIQEILDRGDNAALEQRLKTSKWRSHSNLET